MELLTFVLLVIIAVLLFFLLKKKEIDIARYQEIYGCIK